MKEYLPYIVSVLTALLSFFASLLVNRKNNKAQMKQLQMKHEHDMETQKQDLENKIALLEKEYALKAGTEMMTGFANKTVDAIYNSETVKQQINKNAFRAFSTKKSGKRK